MKSKFWMIKNSNKNNMLLSLVALILVVCMLTSITYAWIDSISTISVTKGTNNVLTIDSMTDSVVKVTTGSEEIDLGSYFNKSGNMHLTSCSSNGQDFYFKNIGSDNSYRYGTINDVNVNYISCTFKIQAMENTVYWFKNFPALFNGEPNEKRDNISDLNKYLSCSITVDGETVLMPGSSTLEEVSITNSETGKEEKVNKFQHINKTDGTTNTVYGVKSTSAYTWDNLGDYLFFVDAGQTKTVNIKLWLENPKGDLINSSDEPLTLDMMLIASLNKQLVYFKDHSFDDVGGTNFVMESDSALHLVDASDPDKYWTFSAVKDADNTYVAEIPIIYRKEKAYIVRCDINPEDSNKNYNIGARSVTINNKKIACDHYWKVEIPRSVNSVTYSVVGNDFYNIPQADATDTGAWIDTEKIYLDDQYGLDASAIKMVLVDADAKDDAIEQKNDMYYDESKGYWVGYAKISSKKLRFKENNNDVIAKWGYRTDNDDVKQERPAGSNVYVIYDKGSTDAKNVGSWTTDENWKSNTSPYVLMGSFNKWSGTPMLYNGDKTTSYASVKVDAGYHSFKIYSTNSGSWYSNYAHPNSFDYVWNQSANITINGKDAFAMGDSDWDKWEVSGTGSTNSENKLYFKPNNNWKQDNARFAAYVFNESNAHEWCPLSYPNKDGYYVTTIPAGMTKVVFCRLDNALDFGNGSDNVQSIHSSLTENFYEDMYVNVVAPDGGTLLFEYNNETDKLDVQYIPSVAESNKVRSYVALNTSWLDWLDQMKATSLSDVNYIEDKSLNSIYKNCFVMHQNYDSTGEWKRFNSNKSYVYLDPRDTVWVNDDAWFAAYFFETGKTDSWAKMTDDDGDGVYSAEIPAGYNNVIFVRKNPSDENLNWNNVWAQTKDLTLNDATTNPTSISYKVYYSDLNKSAGKLQWVNNDTSPATYCPTNGYSVSSLKNGALYYMTYDSANGCGSITSNVQVAPTSLTVKSNGTVVNTTTVGSSLTFKASGSGDGVLDKGEHYSYYVTNTATGTTWVTGSTWRPLFAGTFEVTARADDGYITTAETSSTVSKTIEVN